ncbi:hypothetical protein ACFVDU_29805 [Streptomyces albidoflavus]
MLAATIPPLARIGTTREPDVRDDRPRLIFFDLHGELLSALEPDIVDAQIQTLPVVLGCETSH